MRILSRSSFSTSGSADRYICSCLSRASALRVRLMGMLASLATTSIEPAYTARPIGPPAQSPVHPSRLKSRLHSSVSRRTRAMSRTTCAKRPSRPSTRPSAPSYAATCASSRRASASCARRRSASAGRAARRGGRVVDGSGHVPLRKDRRLERF